MFTSNLKCQQEDDPTVGQQTPFPSIKLPFDIEPHPGDIYLMKTLEMTMMNNEIPLMVQIQMHISYIWEKMNIVGTYLIAL